MRARIVWAICIVFWGVNCGNRSGLKRSTASGGHEGVVSPGGAATGGLSMAAGGDAVTGGSVSNGGATSAGGTTGAAGTLAGGESQNSGGTVGSGGMLVAGGANSGDTPDGGATEASAGGTVSSGGNAGGGSDRGGTSGAGGSAGASGIAGGNPSVKSIVSGQFHNCALMSDGTVKCWGDVSAFGIVSKVPVLIPGITDAVAIAAADSYTCVVLSGGTVECWGVTTGGEYCDQTCGLSRSLPVTITGLTNAVVVSYAAESSCGYEICALQDGGSVQCVGHTCSSRYDQSSMPAPVTISGLTDPTSIAGSCAVLKDQTVACWDSSSAVATAIAGISNAVSVSGNCALLADGGVTCWNGSPAVATTAAGVANAVALASTHYHACVVVSGGLVKCWGSNYDGELGDGTENDSDGPVTVSRIDDAIAVAAGTGHTCALLSSSRVRCWGTNLLGQLGDGTDSYKSTLPVTVQGL